MGRFAAFLGIEPFAAVRVLLNGAIAVQVHVVLQY